MPLAAPPSSDFARHSQTRALADHTPSRVIGDRATRATLSPAALSVILAVRDDEDSVGHQVRKLARHLDALGLDFEIIAVNDGSVDNSLPVLDLLAQHTPGLKILRADSGGRSFQRGVSEARGAVIVLLEAGRPISLAPLAWALSRLAAGRDAVILRGRYIVARRLRVVPVVARATGPSPSFERTFERRAADLRVDIVGNRSTRQDGVRRLLAPVWRFLAV
jgi:glycosyltransferase involved in cell wall biosynthesis